MSRIGKFENWSLEDFIEYNKQYDRGDFRGSETIKYDLDAIEKWISIRDMLTYTEDYSGNWKYIKIFDGYGTKYSTKWIFVDMDKRLWRINTTGDEFYNGPRCEQLFV